VRIRNGVTREEIVEVLLSEDPATRETS